MSLIERGSRLSTRMLLIFLFPIIATGAIHRHSNHAEAPVLAFETQAVAVTGVTPGATVILFAVERERVLYDVSVRNQTIVDRADADGEVRFELKKPLTERVIVAVVDEATGRYAVESPAPRPLRLRHFPLDVLKKKNADYMFADLDFTWVEGICVRPGKGSWQVFVVDGAEFDADGLSDGKTVVDAEKLKKLHGVDESPLRFHKKDVLIFIDPRTMSVMATEVPE